MLNTYNCWQFDDIWNGMRTKQLNGGKKNSRTKPECHCLKKKKKKKQLIKIDDLGVADLEL